MSRPATYDTLQKNLGQDARMTLHQEAVLHETSSWRCVGCNFAADSAHGDPHSDSEAIRAGGETYCLKQIGSYQTLVLSTNFASAQPMQLEERVEEHRELLDFGVSEKRQLLYEVQRDGSILFFW
ncbi:hypothetical protein AK812_SmicGene13029 [Symbiodinium microadriaticum]|uniref:Uncharacterized protein n=1 Tax=Symbiodinium microadriaticum TaxID=2951 RepID=A0A1Q9E932_SYMMI|nr:hypothetical protein AK812_SmicGene13029 [Symbiodinium microadriaticum]